MEITTTLQSQSNKAKVKDQIWAVSLLFSNLDELNLKQQNRCRRFLRRISGRRVDNPQEYAALLINFNSHLQHYSIIYYVTHTSTRLSLIDK